MADREDRRDRRETCEIRNFAFFQRQFFFCCEECDVDIERDRNGRDADLSGCITLSDGEDKITIERD